MALCRQVEEAEGELNMANQELLFEINQMRELIISTLEEYEHLNEKKHELEKPVRVNILNPIQQLRLAKRKSRYLEREFQRMLTGIQNERYISQQELEEDIRLVLTTVKKSFNNENGESKEDLLRKKLCWISSEK